MTKKKTGAPTKYQPIHCEKLIEFFDVEPFKELTRPEVMDVDGVEEIVDVETGKRVANDMPTLIGFAKSIGAGVSTVRAWANDKDEKGKPKNPAFSAAYAHAKDLQKQFLITNGLLGLYNSQAFIFVAKNVTDMKDIQKIEEEKTELVNHIFVVPSFKSYQDQKQLTKTGGNNGNGKVQTK